MKIVSIDNGYFATKVLADNQLQSIRSKYIQDDEGDFEYQGEKYSFGHGSYNIDHDKTENELHKLMTYYILSNLTETTEEFKLVLSLPMLHYKNQREDFKKYIKGDGLITTKLQGHRKSFVISDAIVFLQGAGALYANNPMEYKGKLIGLLDIGGLTAQGAIFEDLKPIRDTMFTIDAGGIILNNKIKTNLNEKYGLNLQDYEIPYLKDFKEDIERIKQEHFQTIILEMKKKNWNIGNLPILATGGASQIIDVSKHLANCKLTQNPIYDHVKGLGMVGRMMYK